MIRIEENNMFNSIHICVCCCVHEFNALLLLPSSYNTFLSQIDWIIFYSSSFLREKQK